MKRAFLLVFLTTIIFAGEEPDSLGNALPMEPTRTVSFTTDEGTWLSLDISPEGKTIVFELLGDLYTLPIRGGKATRITSGMAFDPWKPSIACVRSNFRSNAPSVVGIIPNSCEAIATK